MMSPILTKLAREIEQEEKNQSSEPEPKEEALSQEDGSVNTESSDDTTEEHPAAPNTSIDPLAIMDFFATNSGATDEQFHSFAEQNGFNLEAAESIAYQLASKYMEALRGGKGYGLDPNSVDPQQIEWGIAIESEHSSDPAMQLKITLDHLAENPEYYSMDYMQEELQREHGSEQDNLPEEVEAEKLSACKAPMRKKKAIMVKTAKPAKSLSKFLGMVTQQAKKQSEGTARRNITNITMAAKYPGKPMGGITKKSAMHPTVLQNKLIQAASKLKKPGTFNRVLDKVYK